LAHAWRWCRRQPVVAGLIAAVAVTLVAGIVVSSRFALVAEAKRAEAEKQQLRAETSENLAEAAADGERRAREKETLTLADAHTSLGLIAGEQNKPYEAVQWFASAVKLAHGDPQRELANRTRLNTWTRRLAYPVAAMVQPGQRIARMDFHPNDRYLLVSTTDNAYSLLDLQTSDVAQLAIATKGTGCAAWSPSGKLLAIGGPQGNVDVFDFPDCSLRLTFRHPGAIRALTFSPDGSYLAMGSNVMRVWSFPKNRFLSGVLPHPRPVIGIDFDPASRRIVTSCLDNRARVFAIDGEKLGPNPVFPPTEHVVRSSLLWGNGFCATLIAECGLLVSKDHKVVRWLNAETGAEIRTLSHWETIFGMKASNDKNRFVVVGQGACLICNAAEPYSTGVSLEPRERVADGAFSPDGNSVITAGIDHRSARFWSLPTGEAVDVPLFHQDVVVNAAYSQSGKLVATAQLDGLVRVWKLPSPLRSPRISVRPFSDKAHFVPSNDGKWILACDSHTNGGVPEIQVREARSGRPVGAPLTANARIHGADFSTDGSRVIAAVGRSSNGPGEIIAWDWRTGRQCYPAIPAPSEPADVACSPNGNCAVAVCAGGQVMIFDTATSRTVKCVKHGESAVTWWKQPKRWAVFSRDGKYFATLGLGNSVRIWKASGELTGTVQHRDAVKQAVFSPSGDYLATASYDHSVLVCRAPSGQIVKRLSHSDWVFTVQFSEDQRRVLTACRDGMARLWNWEEERLACPGFEHNDLVCDARFIPNHPWILTLGADGTICGWESQTGKPVMPPLTTSRGYGSEHRDLLITSDGTHVAVPRSQDGFDLYDIANTGLLESNQFDLEGLQVLAEICSGRQIIASGTVNLTASEWSKRWNTLFTEYQRYWGNSGDTPPVAPGDADRARASFPALADWVGQRWTAESAADAHREEAAKRRSALVGKTLQLAGIAHDGKSFDWNAYRGKVTLVEFWTTYSAESATLLTATRGFYELYHDAGLEVIGVNVDEDRRLLDRFVAKRDIPWTILQASSIELKEVADECGISEVPMALLVDREGKVVWQATTAEEFAGKLRELLGAFRGRLACLNLQPKANWRLSDGYSTNPGSNLASLPRGERDFGGVKFNVGVSALRLGSKHLDTFPERIENIPVNSLAAKLYFLHAAAYGAKDGAPIGEYVVHYADGAVGSIPILYGRDVRNWFDLAFAEYQEGGPATSAAVAWHGRNPSSAANNAAIRLFLGVWKNPRPATKIVSLDYVSKMTDASPFCVAITVEGPTATTPR
jgi:WD40 repeat protein